MSEYDHSNDNSIRWNEWNDNNDNDRNMFNKKKAEKLFMKKQSKTFKKLVLISFV